VSNSEARINKFISIVSEVRQKVGSKLFEHSDALHRSTKAGSNGEADLVDSLGIPWALSFLSKILAGRTRVTDKNEISELADLLILQQIRASGSQQITESLFSIVNESVQSSLASELYTQFKIPQFEAEVSDKILENEQSVADSCQ